MEIEIEKQKCSCNHFNWMDACAKYLNRFTNHSLSQQIPIIYNGKQQAELKAVAVLVIE